jgi:hypothetical protein
MSTESTKTLQFKYPITLLKYIHNKFKFVNAHIESVIYTKLDFKDGVITYERTLVLISPVPYLVAKLLSIASKIHIREKGTITDSKTTYVSGTDENSVSEEICITHEGNQTVIDLSVINLPQNGMISKLNGIYIKERTKSFEDDSIEVDKFEPTLKDIYAIMRKGS